MPNIYIENAEKWRILADIDYITQFVKAWISFNAWYKNNFPSLKTDRAAIEEIKNGNNKFKDRLESLLNGDDNDSKTMKNAISNLHYQLERHYVNNGDQRISFENVIIDPNSKNNEIITRNTWRYEVTRDQNNNKLIELKITDRHGKVKLLIQQTNGFNLDELKNDSRYLKLTRNQRGNLEYCYNEINPKKPICLISRDKDHINIGSYDFINDLDKLCKGIITVLYLLRNSLFHGQIIPDKETNKVYESAYRILHKLIEEL